MQLDDKTEKIAILEQEIKSKENRALSLETIIMDMQGKLR